MAQIMTSCHLFQPAKKEGSAEQTLPVSLRQSCVHPSAHTEIPRRTRSRRLVSLTAAAAHVKPLARVSSKDPQFFYTIFQYIKA